jgi:ATP-dependent RNA helicase HelY
MQYRGLKLDRFQAEAIEAIAEGHSVLVAAPTGTGKTLIADYLIEHILADGGEIIYTAPVKALSNQKYRQYVALYGREKVGLITGDLVINRDAPIRIMTTEILRNILLEGGNVIPHEEMPDESEGVSPSDVELNQIENLRAVIIDEIHFLDDPERGTVWEELLIYLPSEIRILGLSATLSNLEEFADWLSSIRKTDIKVVLEEKRSVPLELQLASHREGLQGLEDFNKAFVRWKKDKKKERKKERGSIDSRGRRGERRGGRRDRDREGQDERDRLTTHLDVIEMMPRSNYPALYFIYSRKLVEVFATKLAFSRVGDSLCDAAQTSAIQKHLDTFEATYPGVLPGKLRKMYRKAIAFHHAGLHVALKALVEELYEARLLKVLYCTSTFAMGINMPARTVIFDSLTKFNGTEIVPLTVREFMQMAGRAGRRGIDDRGLIVVRQDFQDYPEVQSLLKKLLSNKSEPVVSSFNLSFHSIVNLVDRFDEERIRYMLEQSFKAFQSVQNAQALRHQIERMQDVEQDFDEQEPGLSRRKRRELASLQRDLVEHERPRLWETFQRKVAFLRSYGYLGDHNELHNGARILRHIKIEEIFVTELVLSGVLEDLRPEELFGVMCGLVQTLPRSARVRRPDDDKWWGLFDAITAIRESDIVADAELLMDQDTVYTPELMPLGERWARGDSLATILEDIRNPTDMSGDLVGAFRRAKDLIGQLRHVYLADEHRRRELSVLLRQVTRDEVEVID